MMGGVVGGVTLPLSEQQDYISVDVNGLGDVTNQSHLTKVRRKREREPVWSVCVCVCVCVQVEFSLIIHRL